MEEVIKPKDHSPGEATKSLPLIDIVSHGKILLHSSDLSAVDVSMPHLNLSCRILYGLWKVWSAMLI